MKVISDNYGRLHQHLAQAGAALPYHPFGCKLSGNQENDYTILFFQDVITFVRSESKQTRSWSRSRYFQVRVGVGVGVLEIHRLRSPASNTTVDIVYRRLIVKRHVFG